MIWPGFTRLLTEPRPPAYVIPANAGIQFGRVAHPLNDGSGTRAGYGRPLSFAGGSDKNSESLFEPGDWNFLMPTPLTDAFPNQTLQTIHDLFQGHVSRVDPRGRSGIQQRLPLNGIHRVPTTDIRENLLK